MKEAREIKELCRKYKSRFIINDNVEIAKAIDETLEKGGICIIGGKNQIDQCDLDEVISL